LTYKLVYTQRAVKDIRKLEQISKKRIGRALVRYEEDPLKYAEKLIDPRLGTYRFRIGDYRVVFDLKGNEIIVLRVGHRKDIYKKG